MGEMEKTINKIPDPPAAVPMAIAPIKKYFAELIGTMVLVLMGCGGAVIAGFATGNVGISFCFGLAVLAMVYTIGSVSGCHINPAITISMLVAGKINVKDTIFYVIFQSVGAIVGAGILYAIMSGNASYNLAVNGLGANSYRHILWGPYS